VTLKSGLYITDGHIQTGTIRKLECGFLFAFHSNYGRILSLTVYVIFNVKNSVTLKTELGVVQGHWIWHRSIDHRAYTTFYWSAIVNIALSCTVFCVNWRWI